MEAELLSLFLLHTLGVAVFGKFESETPWWRPVLKWVILLGLISWGFSAIGHWTLLIIGALGVAGLTFHFVWCRRNQIHPLRATPRKRYYELGG